MGIALPQLAPASEDRVSGAQVVDGSLKFQSANKNYLSQTIDNGTSGFTLSLWMKPFQTGSRDEIFDTVASTGFYLYRHTDGSIRVNNNSSALFTSNGLYRDSSAFYHIVFSYNSTAGYGSLYVNGRHDKSTVFATQLYAGTAKISSEASSDPAEYSLAQWYLIDGQQLGPSYFAYTDPLTNTWRPKKFKAQGTTVNDGTVWSNASMSGDGTVSNKTNAFDGGISNTTGSTGANTNLTFTFTKSIPVKNSVKVYHNQSGTIKINNETAVSTSSGGANWVTLFRGQTNFTSLTLTSTGGDTCDLRAIAVDGVILKDSTTQNLAFGTNGFYLPMDGNSPIGVDKSGQGNNWTPKGFGGSLELDNPNVSGARPILNTGTGGTVARPGVFGSEAGAFYATTSASNSGGKYYFSHDAAAQPTFSFIRGATYTFDYSASSSHPLRFATAADAAGSTEYTNGTSISGNVIKFTVPHNAPDTLYYYCNVHNGMGNSISVTTDETKADKYASNCILALPLLEANDVSGDMNCTTTNDAITNNSLSFNSDQSVFYNRSADPEGSQYLSGVDLSSWNTEQPWTIEFWWYRTGANTNDHGHFVGGTIGGTNQYGPTYRDGSHNDWQFNFKGQSIVITPSPALLTDKWEHHAFTSNGNNISYFRDGVFQNTTSASSMTGSWGSSNEIFRGGAGWSSQYVKGHVCDMRVYTVEKYTTAGFIPASTSPDILPDTPSGVATKTQLTKITDGAVAFDGTGDHLLLPASADFNFGSGDFTLEFFWYPTSTARQGLYHGSFGADWSIGIDYSSTGGNKKLGFWASSNGSSWDIANADGGGNGITTGEPTQNAWNHIVSVRNGNTFAMYLNGKNIGSITSSATISLADTDTPVIGAWWNSESAMSDVHGFISNFRILKGTAVYTSEFTPPTRTLTNVTNTKLLCCQSPTDETAAAVIPTGKINDTTISGYRQSSGTWDGSSSATSTSSPLNIDVRYWSDLGTNRSIDQVTFDVVASGQSSDSGPNYIIYYTTSSSSGGSSVCNSGCTATAIPVASGTSPGTYSVTVTFPSRVTARYIAITNGKSTAGGTYVYSNVKIRSNVNATTLNPFTTNIDAVQTGYATFNPLVLINGGSAVFSDGNLNIRGGSTNGASSSTINPTSGKYYFELDISYVSGQTQGNMGVGIVNELNYGAGNPSGNSYPSTFCGFFTRTEINSVVNGSETGAQTTEPTVNYTWGLEVDYDAKLITLHLDGIKGRSVSFSTVTTPLLYFLWGNTDNTMIVNFGQKPFKYAPPAGFQSLNAASLRPETVIARPDQFVGIVTYTGNVTARSITMDNSLMSPDFVWIKTRNHAYWHYLYDTVRGATKEIYSNATNAEATDAGGLTSFDSNGFSLGTNIATNGSAKTLVAWCWKAGGSKNTFNVDDVGYASAAAAGLNGGSLAVTGASVGTKQGFSIIKYNHDQNSAQTLSHGLTQTPLFIMDKRLKSGTTTNWDVYHYKGAANPEQGRLILNSTAAYSDEDGPWNDTAPTSSVFTVGPNSWKGDGDHIVYLWHDVPGLQKFGTYIGNGQQNNFVELGFRPAIVWVKRAIANSSPDASTNYTSWVIMDSTRLSYNGLTPNHLFANKSINEGYRANGANTSSLGDMLLEPYSNGFFMNNYGSEVNSNTSQYIYCAWAEAPVSGLYGAQSNAR